MLVHTDEQTSDSDNTPLEHPLSHCNMGFHGSRSGSTHKNEHMQMRYTRSQIQAPESKTQTHSK